MIFEPGRGYVNVYFMAVDAAGHSSIVRQNDADAADRAFDQFEQLVYQAVDDAMSRHRCQYAEFWGWRGDGGLCVLYDDDESFARRAALEAADYILEELPALNRRVERAGLRGELHVRIALHKGSFRYKGDERRGSIHSSQLNFCAHLEHVTPRDSVAISEDIYAITGDEGRLFVEAPLAYEGRRVFLKSIRPASEIQAEWKTKVAPASALAVVLRTDVDDTHLGLVGCYANRTITGGYAALLATAKERIWVAAIGLAGFQADHRQIVEDKVVEGLDVRILALEPDPAQVALVVRDTTYALPGWYDAVSGQGTYCTRAAESLSGWVTEVNSAALERTEDPVRRIRMRYSAVFPAGATFLVDDAAFFSPYLGHTLSLKMPSFEAVRGGVLFEKIFGSFLHVWDDEHLSRPPGDAVGA